MLFRSYSGNKTLGEKVNAYAEVNDMFKKNTGIVPKLWLQKYAQVSMHERLGGMARSKIEFHIRYAYAKKHWNAKSS